MIGQEIVRRERELDAQVKKPAQAEKFRLETLVCLCVRFCSFHAYLSQFYIQAEGNKNRAVLEADAKAQAIKVSVGQGWRDVQT